MEEKEEKTIPWDIAFSLLDSNGFDVYPPYTKVGECKKTVCCAYGYISIKSYRP